MAARALSRQDKEGLARVVLVELKSTSATTSRVTPIVVMIGEARSTIAGEVNARESHAIASAS
jgi:hypothetical protein